MSLKNRSFLKLLDYTPAEMEELLDLAADLKAKKKAGIRHNDQLAGKNIALIFEKTSTRTRCSFEVAAHDLGMEVTYLDPSGSQIGKKESIADTARVLGRMFDGIEYRGYGQQIVEDLAHYAGVPVWNGLTNEFHPTQILADFLTIREHFGRLKGIHFVYFGDARYNMGNSLMVGCAKMGLHFTACAPKKYQPDAALVEQCQAIAAQTGATAEIRSCLPVHNTPCMEALAKRGAGAFWLSPEITLDEIVSLGAAAPAALGITVFGRPRVMTSEHCILQVANGCIHDCANCRLRARKLSLKNIDGKVMPVRTDIHGRSRLYDAYPIDLTPQVPQLLDAGVRRLMVDGTLLEADEVGRAVARVRRAVEAAQAGRKPAARLRGATSGCMFVGIS